MEKVREMLTLMGFILERYEETAEGKAAARTFVEIHRRLGEDGDVTSAMQKYREQEDNEKMMLRLLDDLFGMDVAEARLFYQKLIAAHSQWTDWASNLFQLEGRIDIVESSGTQREWEQLQEGDSVEEMRQLVEALEDQLEVAQTRAETLVTDLGLPDMSDVVLPGGIQLLQ